MKLQLRSPSLSAFYHLQAWCALVAPNPILASNFRPQTTIQPIRRCAPVRSIIHSPRLSHHRNTIEFA
jgi:hypothetical protein